MLNQVQHDKEGDDIFMTKTIKHIQKRDGRKVDFDPSKITNAIYKAFIATGEVGDEVAAKKEAERLTPIAIALFSKVVNGDTPNVETMQDVVEQTLMAAGHYQTAKAYILYRERQQEKRSAKAVIGVEDDLDLGINQLKVIERRYLRHDENGKVIETPKDLFTRVAKAIAANETKDKLKWQKEFFTIMANFEFMPAGGYLRAAGSEKPMIANCFVLPVEDSMEGIFDSVKWMALIHQKGGGTGFNFSKLRPKGDFISSSAGFSSGPVSFMKVFDSATAQVMQGGFRRGANMGILNIDHPDIFDFINCKSEETDINNFNISVGMSDEFMQAVDKDKEFELKNPRTGELIQSISARTLYDQIVTLAWRTGDPGVIFLDAINRQNPLIDTLGPMSATNPCGEQPLHPFDVCNLGSINLSNFVKKTQDLEKSQNQNSKVKIEMQNSKLINWERLEEVVRLAVRFLDNGVDISTYPIEQVEQMAKANRRIGLGVMGWADMLYQLQIGYNSEQAYSLAEKIMRFIYSVAHDESEQLAEEKGVFPNWEGSSYEKKGIKQRNVALTTIAPTGTISMVSDCSSGIEPIYALSYVKNVVDDAGLTYVNPYFAKALEVVVEDEIQRQEILEQVAQTGSCQNVDGVSDELKQVFVTAHDIAWDEHVHMQAAFQKYTDNAVSKTINFPNSATIEEISQAYMLAWKLGCKGVTIYRDGSKAVQILQSPKASSAKQNKQGKKLVIQSKIKVKTLKERMGEQVIGDRLQVTGRDDKKECDLHSPDKGRSQVKDMTEGFKIVGKEQKTKTYQPSTDSCPECGGQLQMSEGCSMCLACGFSKCSL